MTSRKKYLHYVGIDEVGRGSLAGPVCAAAVLSSTLSHALFSRHTSLDSKTYTPKEREKIFKELSGTLPWGLGSVPAKTIDKIGIERANFLAMERALENLVKKTRISLQKTLLLIDGNRLNGPKLQALNHKLIVRGDEKILLIGAASILAKVSRDRHMERLHKKYSHYKWGKNKGYGTKDHRNAIKKHGITPLHRKSFSL